MNSRWKSTMCERCRRSIMTHAQPPTDPVRLKYYKVCGHCLTKEEALELSNATFPTVGVTYERI